MTVVLICGAANLLADGLSMAVGNYLAIRSHESVLESEGQPEERRSRSATVRRRFSPSWSQDHCRSCRT